MGLFSQRKQTRGDSLRTQAETLVTSASIVATSSYTSMAQRLNLVYSIPTERWDSVLTVAGVFLAATRANQVGLSEESVDSLMEIVSERLNTWSPTGLAAFEDCKAFFDRTYDALETGAFYKEHPEFLGCDAVGSWMVWNLLGRAPTTPPEKSLIRDLGVLVTHSFHNWWSTKGK